MAKRGAPLGNTNATGSAGGGRPPNWLKEACREAAYSTDTIGLLKREIQNNGRDRIKAIEMLWDRGWGKAEQSVDLTQHDAERPTTEALIETIRALREQLGIAGERVKSETGE